MNKMNTAPTTLRQGDSIRDDELTPSPFAR